MAFKLSPSSISLYRECPRCFWLEHIKGIKRPAGIFPSLPSGVDKVLKEHFNRHRARGEVPKELDLKDVKLFADTARLKVWTSNFKGISYTDSDGNILHGAVDEILQTQTKSKDFAEPHKTKGFATGGNKLIVLDFKTRGFPCKDDTHEHYVDQLNIYNFLFRKNSYETEDYSYLLFFHPKEVTEKGTIVFNIDLKKMPVDIEAAERLWKDALDCLNGKEPEPNERCGWCSRSG